MKPKKDLNMKKLFRRNQVIITALAVMIAAAGYLNYAGKQELAAGSQVYEAGILEISDEDVLAENQASEYYGETLAEIDSLDADILDEEAQEAAMAEEAEVMEEAGTAELDGAAAETVKEAEGAVPDGSGEQLAAAEGTETEGTGTGEDGESAQTGLDNPGEAVLTSGMSVTDYIGSVQLNREQVRAKNKESLMSIINSTGIEEAAKQQAIQDMLELTETAEKENAAETLLMARGFADPVVSVSSDQVDVVINASSITDQQRAQIEDIVKRKTERSADQIVISLLNLQE